VQARLWSALSILGAVPLRPGSKSHETGSTMANLRHLQ
jgi:hypothetical protein